MPIKVWLILVFLPVNIYLAYGLISELYGPSIYGSLLADFGSSIIVYCWAVATVLAISPIIGFVLGDKKETYTTRERSCSGAVDG